MSRIPEVMLDLETLSTRAHATIIVIAGVKFDRKTGATEDSPFYRKIDVKSCEKLGLHVDENTVKWWKEQDPKVQKEAFEGEKISLKKALKEFTVWFDNSEKIWSNGATFDIPILNEAYRRCEMEPPWKFFNARDTRTLYELANIKSKDLPQENLHNAIQDCFRQIWGVTESLKRINL